MTLIKSCDQHGTVYYKQCRECLHDLARAEKQEIKEANKLKANMLKAKERAKELRKRVSKNPKDWKNTFLCSDGTRVTQAEINENRAHSYIRYDSLRQVIMCEGCGGIAQGHAHIIPQAMCKSLGKTELIWSHNNFFLACNACNLAIENPKGKAWKALKNLDYCMATIKAHAPELYAKFEQAATDQSRKTTI